MSFVAKGGEFRRKSISSRKGEFCREWVSSRKWWISSRVSFVAKYFATKLTDLLYTEVCHKSEKPKTSKMDTLDTTDNKIFKSSQRLSNWLLIRAGQMLYLFKTFFLEWVVIFVKVFFLKINLCEKPDILIFFEFFRVHFSFYLFKRPCCIF